MKSKLDQFSLLLGMNINDIMYNEYEGDIYHYTSPSGVNSILFGDSNNITFWASRYDCLNDVSEGTIAQAIYREVCETMKQKTEITNDMYNVIADIVPDRTTLFMYKESGKNGITRQECDRFVCSYSKNYDSLSMWNYYSKGSKYEGYNIGLFSTSIKDSLVKEYDDKEIAVHICSVVYKKEEQVEMIRKLILKLQELYSEDQKSSIRYIISNKLTEWSLIFKSEYFQHEEEVRIIVDVSKKTKDGVVQKRPLDIKYRNAYGYIIPYIELKIDKEALTSVSIGPLQCDENSRKIQKRIMKEFLYEKYRKVIVLCSQIPVRY